MEEITMLKVLDLCSGVGGSILGLVAADLHNQFEPAVFVENNLYCQSVLAKWFPSVPIHDDIKTFHAKPGQFDIAIAGFPCPPFSLAGKGEGADDSRNLWPEVYRVLQESTPIGFILENVPGIRHSNNGQFLRDILKDIASIGYDAEWGILSVQALGGVHRRERFFLIAYSKSQRRTSEQLPNSPQEETNRTPSTPHNPTIPHWTSTIAKANPTHARLPAFLAGCLMQHSDLPQALANATVKATPEEVKEALQAVGNSIAPLQVAQVWKRLYKRLCYLEH
jgi:DNA-cytosine methyltransferase